jgi:hypothetical protein
MLLANYAVLCEKQGKADMAATFKSRAKKIYEKQ